MKKSKLIIFAFILLSLACTMSCETLVGEVSPDKLPKLEEKLVVNSFISPQDTLVRVIVTTSSPIFTPAKNTFGGFVIINGDTTFFGNDAFVNNAKVSMGNGEKTIELTYNSAEKWYEFRPSTSTIRIEAEKEYFLTVSHDNRTAQASCVVPQRRDNFVQVLAKTEENTFRFSGQPDQKNLTLTATVFVDINKETPTYYRLRGDVAVDLEQLEFSQGQEPEFVTRRSYRSVFFENQGIIDGTDITLSRSQTKSGTAFFSSPSTFIGGERIFSEKYPEVRSLYVELMTINEPYFKYYKSIADFNGDNPFIEPTPIYTNIQGGLGVFAASNRRGQTIPFMNNQPRF